VTYKNASGKSQLKAQRITLKDFVKGGSDLTEDEQLEVVRGKVRGIELMLTEIPMNHPDRGILGQQKFLLTEEIRKLKKRKKIPNIHHCFMDAAFNLLLPDAYNAICEEARYIADIRNKGQKYDAINRRSELQIKKAMNAVSSIVKVEIKE
jgi:hypothetical protein